MAKRVQNAGRGGDTMLAHITPEEAGILKLLGGSGTINPRTGQPEFLKKLIKKIVPKEIYKPISSIGKEFERGVESIAQNKYLGPIAQMASYLHPVSAFLYAGLAPEGSSFDTKGAAKAAVMQQIAQGVKEYAMGTPAGTPMDGSTMATGADPFMSAPDVNAFGLSDYATQQAIDNAAGFVGDPTYYPSVEAAVSSAGSAPFATGPEVVNAGITPPIERGVEITQIPASGAEGASMSNLPYSDPYAVDNIGNVSESRVMGDYGYGSAPVVDRSAPLTDYSGARNLDPAGENFLGAAGSLAESAYDLAVYNPKTAATAAYMGYTAYQTKKELDAARDEANRILADRENKKKEEIEWAQSVIRDYPFNFQRLTEEDVRRERGMAMGGRINSYDDEIGGDDNMMQGGIASLAKGGLPPRYLRGGGDGMSDSIRARIGGKQEARLADGEFVVPADVVSHLGNGSSNAGAKKLYAMMDRVRRSRTGKTRQAPEVNTRRLMPA
jgi:hypothetical protein